MIGTSPPSVRVDRNRSRGSALLMAVFVLLLLSAMGVTLIFLTRTEVLMSQGSVRAKQSFFLAEAGEEHARALLYAVNGDDDFSDDLAARAGGNDVLDFDATHVRAGYDTDGNVVGLTGFGDDTPLVPVTLLANGQWYAAFLNNDPGEDKTTIVDGNQLVMLTGVGGGPGRSMEIVSAIVEKQETLFSLPPATITLLGPMPEFDGAHSNVHRYSGNDCGGAGIPGLYVPVVGAVGSAAEESAEDGIHGGINGDGNGPDYDAGPYSDVDAFADLTDPINEPALDEAIDPTWTDCDAVREMIEELRSYADVYCCNPPVCATSTSCAMPDPPAIDNLIFVDGDHDVGPEGGLGTLVVTGRLSYAGRGSWNGIILVFGAGEFMQHGAGNGTISGAIMVADVAGPDNIYRTPDDCSGPDGFETAVFDVSGGGTATTTFCSTDILAARPIPPYRILSFRQY